MWSLQISENRTENSYGASSAANASVTGSIKAAKSSAKTFISKFFFIRNILSNLFDEGTPCGVRKNSL